MSQVIIDGLSFALPLLIIAIGGLYAERSGVINLALEGLLGFGAFVGALIAALIAPNFSANSQMPMYLAFLFAMVGGIVFSSIYAILCIKFKANQVIAGVVINILSMALTSFLTSQINSTFFGKPSNKFVLQVSNRFTVPVISKIPVIGAIFTDVYPYEVIIVVFAIIFWYVLYNTKFGMRLRACGENPQAIDAVGVNVFKIRTIAVLISGALCGIGGMSFAYSISANFSQSIYFGAGYLAIAAYIFGNWKIVPTFAGCILFGFARSAGYKISQMMNFPSSFSDLIMILPYVLTLMLLVFFSKKNRAPKSLGEIYDKGKR